WQSKGLDKRERGVAQQFVRKLETFDSFSLPFRFVRAEAVHGRSELGQFGVAVAERARLRRASPGPRDRIPCRGRRLIRPSGVGIAKDHAEPGQPRDVRRSSRRRRKPDRGKPAPGEVIARAVVDGDGETRGKFRWSSRFHVEPNGTGTEIPSGLIASPQPTAKYVKRFPATIKRRRVRWPR